MEEEKTKTIEAIMSEKMIGLTDIWYLGDEMNIKVEYDSANYEFKIEFQKENNGDGFTDKSFMIEKKDMQLFQESINDFFEIINKQIK